jgi:hypothetical protein
VAQAQLSTVWELGQRLEDELVCRPVAIFLQQPGDDRRGPSQAGRQRGIVGVTADVLSEQAHHVGKSRVAPRRVKLDGGEHAGEPLAAALLLLRGHLAQKRCEATAGSPAIALGERQLGQPLDLQGGGVRRRGARVGHPLKRRRREAKRHLRCEGIDRPVDPHLGKRTLETAAERVAAVAVRDARLAHEPRRVNKEGEVLRVPPVVDMTRLGEIAVAVGASGGR